MLSKLRSLVGMSSPESEATKAEQRAEDQKLSKQDPHPDTYSADSMTVIGRNLAFLQNPAFDEAYQIGVNSGHKIAGGPELDVRWRVHVLCWAARHALHLRGDFVECGVNTGIFSLAVCNFIDFNTTGKRFFLFDTFKGIPERQMSEAERPYRVAENELMYEECYDLARNNFAPFPNAQIIRGEVPDSLSQVEIDKVCYLSLDMNITKPEIAALEHFWDRLVSGAPVILDDYGWNHYREQHEAVDVFADRRDVMVATLPTGQWLLLKP